MVLFGCPGMFSFSEFDHPESKTMLLFSSLRLSKVENLLLSTFSLPKWKTVFCFPEFVCQSGKQCVYPLQLGCPKWKTVFCFLQCVAQSGKRCFVFCSRLPKVENSVLFSAVGCPKGKTVFCFLQCVAQGGKECFVFCSRLPKVENSVLFSAVGCPRWKRVFCFLQ